MKLIRRWIKQRKCKHLRKTLHYNMKHRIYTYTCLNCGKKGYHKRWKNKEINKGVIK